MEQSVDCDVLVVGSGAGGLSAAVTAALDKAGDNAPVRCALLVTVGRIGDGDTWKVLDSAVSAKDPAVQESAAAAESMRRHAEALLRAVSAFRIGGAGGGALAAARAAAQERRRSIGVMGASSKRGQSTTRAPVLH